jgi:hypothetical protein
VRRGGKKPDWSESLSLRCRAARRERRESSLGSVKRGCPSRQQRIDHLRRWAGCPVDEALQRRGRLDLAGQPGPPCAEGCARDAEEARQHTRSSSARILSGRTTDGTGRIAQPPRRYRQTSRRARGPAAAARRIDGRQGGLAHRGIRELGGPEGDDGAGRQRQARLTLRICQVVKRCPWTARTCTSPQGPVPRRPPPRCPPRASKRRSISGLRAAVDVQGTARQRPGATGGPCSASSFTKPAPSQGRPIVWT